MSIVTRIAKSDGEVDYKALGEFIIEYEKKLEGWEECLRIDKKRLADAIVEQPSWAAYYDQIKVDLEVAVVFFDILMDQRAEEIYSTLKENSGYSYSETAIKRIIAGNKRYVQLRRLRLELLEMKERAKSIADQFYQRSFTLKNYLKMLELEAQDITMTI